MTGEPHTPADPREHPAPEAPAGEGSEATDTGIGSRVRARLAALGARISAWWSSTRRLWRTSLQFRVVVTTMLFGTVVTLILQTFLYGRIADGLVSARMATAQEEAAFGAQDVRTRLTQADQTDTASILQYAFDLVRQQESQTPDQTRELILVRSVDNTFGPARVPAFYTRLRTDILPAELRQAIADDPTHQQVQIVSVPLDDAQVPAILIGTQIQIPDAGPYELYHVFPMQREQGIMAMVWRVFLVGSIALVATLGLVAFIVTRLVVDPLRQASEVAHRLSTGHLNERMLVRGEDDIAQLAQAFNDMAEHLQQQIRQLEDLSAVQQRFVSDVSHELRTPLTTIHMASTMIHDQRDSLDPVLARSTELLHTQVERFEALLADLLEISRFDAGGAVLDLEAVDLRTLVTRVVTSAEQLAEAKGSPIVVVGDEEPRVAAVDTRRIERVLRNLLVNAVEHGEGRPVTIELGSDASAVAVVVADRGIGLKSGQADLVFNRFWRGDPSRKRTTGGTGLGLAIALEDTRLHQGWLQAWGEEGFGSRFRLTLPRAAGASVEASPLPLVPFEDEPENTRASTAPALTDVPSDESAGDRAEGTATPVAEAGSAASDTHEARA